jgi:hypothetical protein
MRLILTAAKKIFFVLFFFLMVSYACAQPGGGGDPDPGQPVPIQGLIFLLLAGAFLGIKRIMHKKKDCN